MAAKRQPNSFDPGRPDFAQYGLTCVRWSPSRMQRPDHHNEVELNFLESGSVTYLLGSQEVVVEVGRLGVFWAAVPHQIVDFSAGTAYFVVTIPLQYFLQWRLPEDFVHPLMQGRLLSEPNDGRADSDAVSFTRWEDDLQRNAPRLERPVLLEMQARLFRLALELSTAPDEGQSRLAAITDIGLTKVERMACFVAQHYTEKLTVKQVSELVKLHPNYAMNLFQKTFRMTLVTFLTQHRVAHAQRLLVASNQTATEIALQSGFQSLSRFNAAFRRACGCSPREYRKSHERLGSLARPQLGPARGTP
jgi:AraC-like DNA-binding protein